MIKTNVEKYCIYNGERKCPLKKKEFLDNDKDINNREEEKKKRREEEKKE